MDKNAVSKALGVTEYPFASLEIKHGGDGAPEAWRGGKKLSVQVSITHTAKTAAAVAVQYGVFYYHSIGMKKCLVLDLDNTLWGGVAGEDGISNIALSMSAPGNSFVAFQQAILDHYNRGILLAINSRNNPEDAWEVIRNHPNMILKEHHFSASRINWNDKDKNLRELAEELNIGLDAMVFLDDDRVNRELVRAFVPEVETPDFPSDPSEYARFLNSLDYFPKEAVTDEDKMRGNLYVTERLRKEEEKTYENKDDFLKSLSLELTVYEDDDSCVPRLSQMTEKTNQFNVDKQPLSEDEINFFIKSREHTVFYGSLTDKFGDYGVIIVAILGSHDKHWHIKSLLMSCRVIGREVEDAFLSVIRTRAKEAQVEYITIGYRKMERNEPARQFVEKHFGQGKYTVPAEVYTPPWIKLTYANL